MATDEFEDFDEFEDLDEAEEAAAPARKSTRKKAAGKAKGGTATEVKISAEDVAERLGTNGRTFRGWLRRKVDAGEFPGLAKREKKSRYSWPKWSDTELVAIMKAWNSEDHTRGGAKRGEAKPAAKPAAKKPAAKKPAAKKPAARKGKAKA